MKTTHFCSLYRQDFPEGDTSIAEGLIDDYPMYEMRLFDTLVFTNDHCKFFSFELVKWMGISRTWMKPVSVCGVGRVRPPKKRFPRRAGRSVPRTLLKNGRSPLRPGSSTLRTDAYSLRFSFRDCVKYQVRTI